MKLKSSACMACYHSACKLYKISASAVVYLPSQVRSEHMRNHKPDTQNIKQPAHMTFTCSKIALMREQSNPGNAQVR